METELIIREKTRTCKELFQRCLEVPDLNEDDWVEQKSAEFNWWTSGLNADKIGPGSLDSRLRLRPDVRDVVADLLEGLMTALSKCEELTSSDTLQEEESSETSSIDDKYLTTDELDRTPSPWSDMSDSAGSSERSPAEDVEDKTAGDLYQEQKFYIETNLEILIRVHAAIKKSGLKFRNKRADDALMRAEERYQLEKARLGQHTALYGSDTSIGEHERFRLFLIRRVLQNGYKEGLLRYIDGNIQRFITTHGPESEDHPYIISQRKILVVSRAYLHDPARLTTIQHRLINANVVRRNRLIHAGGAEKAQSQTKQIEPQPVQKLPIVKETSQQSRVQEQELDHVAQIPAATLSQTPSMSKAKSNKSFVSQAATGLASTFSITAALSPAKRTKSAATKMSARVANIDYPKCPASQGPFPCPYCPSILSHAYTNRTKWRAHVAQDLCAYVCIFEDCEYADDMYTSTYEWMSHMAKHHSVMEWTCTECSKHSMMTDSFDEPVKLKEHILALHPDVESSEMDLLVNAGKRPAGIQRVACPLCRPGLVTSGEEDEYLIHPGDCVEDVGLVQLEEDEHVATHIHEFSLQALPWSGETNTEDKSGMSLSHSTASSRQEITFQSSDDADQVSERAGDFYNADEFVEIIQRMKVEFEPQNQGIPDALKYRIRALHNSFNSTLDELRSNIENIDAATFLAILDECRITACLLQDTTLYPALIFEPEHSQLDNEIIGHLALLRALLEGAYRKATYSRTSSSYLISSRDGSRRNSISHHPRDPDEETTAEDSSLRNQGNNEYDGDDRQQSMVPDAEDDISWDELGHYREAPDGDDAVLQEMIKSKTAQQPPQVPNHWKQATQDIMAEITILEGYDEPFIPEMDIRTYLQYISDERLIRMPHVGSSWDRALAAAEAFGSQIVAFEEAGGIDWLPWREHISRLLSLALAAYQILLNLGEGQANVLGPVFAALNELTFLLKNISEIQHLESLPISIKTNIANLFGDILQLSACMALEYRKRVNSLQSDRASIASFDVKLGKRFNEIWLAKDLIYSEVWTFKLGKRFPMDPQPLSQPPAMIHDDALAQRSGDTFAWIEDRLLKFYSRSLRMFTITGPPGCGKSVLAERVRERCLESFNGEYIHVLSYRYTSELTSNSSILCAERLLLQLLQYFISEAGLHQSLSKVFSFDLEGETPLSLEDDVWITLSEGLKFLDRHSRRDIVIIADLRDQDATFCSDLLKCISGHLRIIVIIFSRHIPVGIEGDMHLEITLDRTRQDIKRHFDQTLSSCAYYKSRTPVARQRLVEGLATKSQGNFLWAFLVAQRMTREPDNDKFINTTYHVSSSIFDILQEIVDILDSKHRKALLVLLKISSAGPLTIRDAGAILCDEVVTKPSEIFQRMPEECRDLTIIRDNRLCFRHSLLREYFSGLVTGIDFGGQRRL